MITGAADIAVAAGVSVVGVAALLLAVWTVHRAG